MKIFRVVATVLFGICALTGCDLERTSSLKDISRPYVGEYKCKKLQIGGEEELSRFESVKLELTYDGKFCLTYEDTQGGEGAYAGKYTLSEENASLAMTSDEGGKAQTYVFPYENGKVEMRLLFREKLLYAVFSMVD